jgi:hypothetical protein
MSLNQTINGKSFEYALLVQFEEKLRDKTNVEIIKNNSFQIAQKCFNEIKELQKSEFLLYASFAVNFLIDLEPRLANGIDKNDTLELEILPDRAGETGDVRDVLAIRVLQRWEIGVSAKNNHNAVKHSRLSSDIDFGKKWLGIESSKEYFDRINLVFGSLKKIKKESNGTKKWSEIGDYHTSVYLPILIAFIEELEKIYKSNLEKVPTNLVKYLIGNKDFYKVVKNKNSLDIYAYNFNNSLNLSFGNIESKYKIPEIVLPTKILDMSFKENSKNTIIITLDNDWVLSFRIHNASSRVEPSLKFDITLLSSPKTIFKNTLFIK